MKSNMLCARVATASLLLTSVGAAALEQDGATVASQSQAESQLIVVNTWPFVDATAAAWQALSSNSSAVDAIVAVRSAMLLCQLAVCPQELAWSLACKVPVL